MSAHDEWDKQRDVEAEGQRAARPLPEMEVGRFEGITFTVGRVPVEAVPLLLAVAKEARDHRDDACRMPHAALDVAIARLDAAHPDWREWATERL